ncbi:alpha-L-fucosidase [Ketogulonicigenium robustum]|uniref:Alpha-L-fucosidase n=2 Tax=Ketogulonicigenium robustum TaxID=92947 RepID=A0A1W6NZH7_9RHOB|nr:alpha-L-fucosidase [Ketogulonicigenium robustum]
MGLLPVTSFRANLLGLLIDTVSKGGNLLMHVSPTARGRLDAKSTAALQVYADWMRYHRAAIYGARAADLPPLQDCRLTRKGSAVYVHVLVWPFRHLHLPSLGTKVWRARLMNYGSEIKILQPQPPNPNDTMLVPVDPNDLTFGLPVEKPPVAIPVIVLALI